MPENKKISKLKTSIVARSYTLARMGLGAGLQYAVSKIANTPADEYLNNQAKQIIKDLGELKGSMMKAGQMLSIYGEHFLPPETNKILKALQSDSTQVEWSVMKKQLESELTEDLLNQLEIYPEPIGSASMGQVYLATEISSQKKIALKIQYPNVDLAIDSDVAALKKILTFAKLLPHDLDTNPLFEEVKIMLHQELDYQLEAAHTSEYAKLVEQDSRYKVPKVFFDYSTKKILATEYLEGLKPDHDLIQSLPSTRRNRLGENFLDLYFKEIFEWKIVQTDPHLGNYKIQLDAYGNDVIVLLDFGATKIFPTEFLISYRQLIKGAILNDDTLFTQGARALGFIRDSDTNEYLEHFKAFCHETIEPFQQDNTYDWKANDLASRVVKNALQFRKYRLRTPPKELVFLDRKTAGVFMFLNMIGARIAGRKLILPYLENVES